MTLSKAQAHTRPSQTQSKRKHNWAMASCRGLLSLSSPSGFAISRIGQYSIDARRLYHSSLFTFSTINERLQRQRSFCLSSQIVVWISVPPIRTTRGKVQGSIMKRYKADELPLRFNVDDLTRRQDNLCGVELSAHHKSYAAASSRRHYETLQSRRKSSVQR